MLKSPGVKLALLGHPVAHSKSPTLHNQWIADAGIVGEYLTLSVPNVTGFDLREMMVRHGLSGVNVTTPLKEAVFAQVDARSEAAEQAGAVNTVVWQDQMLVGHNTDGTGFMMAMSRYGWLPNPECKVVILGAGGAARGIASRLVQAGVDELVVLNRTESRAQECVASVGCGTAGPLTMEAFERHGKDAALVVHTTSGQGAATVANWAIDGLAPGSFWVDINYWMANPPQQSACEARGVKFVTGWPMLVCQAAHSFRLFTGFEPNPDPFLLHLR